MTCFIQEPLKTYLSSREKSQYIKILKRSIPSIWDFFDAKLDYKVDSIFYYFSFTVVGFLFGAYISQYLFVEVLTKLVDYWFSGFSDFSYIESLSFIKNIDPMYIELITLSGLNIFTFIVFFGVPFYVIFIRSQTRLKPQFTSSCKIKRWLKYAYSSHWFFFGFLIGVYLVIYHFGSSFFREYSFIYTHTEYPKIGIVYLYNSMRINLPYFQYIECVFICGMVNTIFSFIFLYAVSSRIFNYVIEEITDFYQPNFPYIKLKTGNGYIEGSLKDVQNKSLITLSKNNVLTIVPWDKIEIMEVRYPAITEFLGTDVSPAEGEITLIQE